MPKALIIWGMANVDHYGTETLLYAKALIISGMTNDDHYGTDTLLYAQGTNYLGHD